MRLLPQPIEPQPFIFHNDAEPYWVLAARLAKGLPAMEWFWQLAIPKWKPNLPIAEGLRLLLYQMDRLVQVSVQPLLSFNI
jgi:hypothetical protein